MAGFSDAGSWTTALSTGLNSLAAGSIALSSAITPEQASSKEKFYVDLRINLASLAPATGQTLIVHFLPATDSTPTNFADNTLWTRVAVPDLKSGTAAKYLYIPRRMQPKVSFKIGIEQPSGATTLASSGNTVEYLIYTAS